MSRSGPVSVAVPVPSVPGHVRFAPLRQMLFYRVQVRMRMRCHLLQGRVARTSQRCRCHFCIPRNGCWRRAMISFGRKTSEFSKHVPSCMLFIKQRVVIRRDASWSFLTILRWCWRLAKDAQTIFHCFQSCVESLRLVSGQDLSYRSGWKPLELNCSDKGCRFLDSDYDSSKSLE